MRKNPIVVRRTSCHYMYIPVMNDVALGFAWIVISRCIALHCITNRRSSQGPTPNFL